LKHALQNQGANAAQTYIELVNVVITGYYSLAVGQVEDADAPQRLQKGQAKHPVPILLLARLVVHQDGQKKRIGRALLRDAVAFAPWLFMQKMMPRIDIASSSISSPHQQTHCTYLCCSRVS
jgi:hypothetical protein